MGPDWYRSIGVDSSTSINDFVPAENYCNTVVYTHKWYLKPKTKKKKEKQDKWLVKKLICFKKEKKIERKDASTITIDIENSIILGKPLDILKEVAPKEQNTQTIIDLHGVKCTSCKTKFDKMPQKKKEPIDTVYKNTCKKDCHCNDKHKVQELYRRNKAMDSSAKESSTSTVHNNSIDDYTNNSISCSLSDESMHKHPKPEYYKKKIKPEKTKVQTSDSFDALAAEVGNATIKLQLMNDGDKNILTKNLTYPIVNAIREFVTENSQPEIYNEIKMVQNLVLNHSLKLDTISERLSYIEGTLKSCNDTAKVKRNKSKVSTLENLSEDISDVEEFNNCGRKKSDRPIKLSPVLSAEEDNSETLGGDQEVTGQVTPLKSNTQKAPTRFCWTGAVRSNQL